MWITFFFDGTGNNRAQHFPESHSNVVGLHDAHLNAPRAGWIRHYYEGIGTPFEFSNRYVEHRGRGGVVIGTTKGHKDEETGAYDETMNMAYGRHMDVRLEKAMFDLENDIELKRQGRKVTDINIAAFGFSRGATTARAFMHWLTQHSKVKNLGAALEWDGIPLKVKFLGLFDTVESVGEAGGNDQPQLIKTSIPSFVEKCFHVVAAHEMRQSFPVTVLGANKHHQTVYPGAHADIGGGYGPNEQGRPNHLARIALYQMLDEARGAGLKLQSISEMRASDLWERLYAPSFGIPASVMNAWHNYLAQVPVRSGLVHEVIRSHLQLYRAWIDSGLAAEDIDSKQETYRRDSERSVELSNMETLLRFKTRSAQNRTPRRGAVHPAVEFLFEQYVHDSFGHFVLANGGLRLKDMKIADYYRDRTVLAPKS